MTTAFQLRAREAGCIYSIRVEPDPLRLLVARQVAVAQVMRASVPPGGRRVRLSCGLGVSERGGLLSGGDARCLSGRISRARNSGDRISRVLRRVAASRRAVAPIASTVEAAVRRYLARIRRGLFCL